VSFLLPQQRDGTLERVQAVDLHGDRYLDLMVRLDDELQPRTGRLSAHECPPGLAAGTRVKVKFVMGVMTTVTTANP
jgi:hypothetical protein